MFDFIVDNAEDVVENIDISAGYPFKSGELVEHFKYTLEDEQTEAEKIYPAFSKTAKEEGYDEISHVFERIASVENCHYMLLKQIYEGLKNNTLYSSKTPIKWKCSNCGNEHTSEQAFEKCDLCGMAIGYVEIPFITGKIMKNSLISDMDTVNN